MSLHSGRKRFFIYDFKENEISRKYLVGHGVVTILGVPMIQKKIRLSAMKITAIFLH